MYVYTKLLLSDNLASDELLMNLLVSMMLRGDFIEKLTGLSIILLRLFIIRHLLYIIREKNRIIYKMTHIIDNLKLIINNQFTEDLDI